MLQLPPHLIAKGVGGTYWAHGLSQLDSLYYSKRQMLFTMNPLHQCVGLIIHQKTLTMMIAGNDCQETNGSCYWSALCEGRMNIKQPSFDLQKSILRLSWYCKAVHSTRPTHSWLDTIIHSGRLGSNAKRPQQEQSTAKHASTGIYPINRAHNSCSRSKYTGTCSKQPQQQ